MLIVSNWIIFAVLCLAASLFPSCSHQLGQSFRNNTDLIFDLTQEADDLMSVEAGSRWLNHRENQELLKKEAGDKGLPVECCPSIQEMVEPQGGINQDGRLVQLYSEGENRQRFFELSCRIGVEGKPCRFMDRKLYNQSRCVQEYSYTYAIVRQPTARSHTGQRPQHFATFPSGDSNTMLDYIRVRSGCSCKVLPRVKRRRTKGKRTKSKRTEASDEET